MNCAAPRPPVPLRLPLACTAAVPHLPGHRHLHEPGAHQRPALLLPCRHLGAGADAAGVRHGQIPVRRARRHHPAHDPGGRAAGTAVMEAAGRACSSAAGMRSVAVELPFKACVETPEGSPPLRTCATPRRPTADGGGVPAAARGRVLARAARLCAAVHAQGPLAAPVCGAAPAAPVCDAARVRPPLARSGGNASTHGGRAAMLHARDPPPPRPPSCLTTQAAAGGPACLHAWLHVRRCGEAGGRGGGADQPLLQQPVVQLARQRQHRGLLLVGRGARGGRRHRRAHYLGSPTVPASTAVPPRRSN